MNMATTDVLWQHVSINISQESTVHWIQTLSYLSHVKEVLQNAQSAKPCQFTAHTQALHVAPITNRCIAARIRTAKAATSTVTVMINCSSTSHCNDRLGASTCHSWWPAVSKTSNIVQHEFFYDLEGLQNVLQGGENITFLPWPTGAPWFSFNCEWEDLFKVTDWQTDHRTCVWNRSKTLSMQHWVIEAELQMQKCFLFFWNLPI